MIDKHRASHYAWGKGCDGWHLVNTPELSVIQERMPAGTAEQRHRHQDARQSDVVQARPQQGVPTPRPDLERYGETACDQRSVGRHGARDTSIHARTASSSLILHRLGSYARQNPLGPRMHQALQEVGRIEKTMHILRTVHDEDERRRQTRELNKGEASHDLSRFPFFAQEGALRRREFGDQAQSFSALAVLHNALVASNMLEVEDVVKQLRAEGNNLPDEALALTTTLMRKYINPFGRYHFDLSGIRGS